MGQPVFEMRETDDYTTAEWMWLTWTCKSVTGAQGKTTGTLMRGVVSAGSRGVTAGNEQPRGLNSVGV